MLLDHAAHIDFPCQLGSAQIPPSGAAPQLFAGGSCGLGVGLGVGVGAGVGAT